MKIIDPALLTIEEGYTENMQAGRNRMEDINQVMFSITKLAILCSKQAPSERMCIRDAAAEMHRIKDHYAKRRQLKEVTVEIYRKSPFKLSSSTRATPTGETNGLPN